VHTSLPFPRPALLALIALTFAGCSDQTPSPTELTPTPPALAYAQSAAPVFFQLSAAGSTSCGVATDGAAWCWGGVLLGDGSSNGSDAPVRVVGGHAFRQISTDGFHTCGVTEDFHAFCWGGNTSGDLGDGSIDIRLEPTAVAGGHRFYQVDAGGEHTCGVTYPDRAVYCWGENSFGELGDGTLTDRHKPRLVLGNLTWRHVSAGAFHTCGVTTGNQAYCWGSDQFGQLGNDAASARRTRPVVVAGGLAFRQLEAGTSHTCAVTTADVAYCWGYGGLGQLGNGKILNRFTPRAVRTSIHFRRVDPASGFTCAETLASQVYCWGSNEFGQLGDGTKTQRLTPVPVSGGLRFAQVGAGGWNACGKTADGTGYCWGRNDDGQLGDGTKVERHTPTLIVGPVAPALRALAGSRVTPLPLGDTLTRAD